MREYWKVFRINLGLGLLLLLSGCGQATSQNQNLTRPCQATQVRTMAEWQPLTNSLTGKLSFTGLSVNGCVLTGTPSVQLKNAKGEALPLTQTNLATTKEAEQVSLTTGRRATVYIAWTNWCGPDPNTQLTFWVTLPHDTTPTGAAALDARGFPPSKLPPCQDKTKPSLLTVGAFEATFS